MKLFECAFTSGWDSYVRYFDTETKTTKFEKLDTEPEYYVEDPKGSFKCLVSGKKLQRKLGFVPKNVKNSGIKIYGQTTASHAAIRDYYWKDNLYNFNCSRLFLDIETTSIHGKVDSELALETIVLMQMYEPNLDQMIVLGLKDTNIDESKYEYNVKYIKFDTERDLLNAFCKLIQKIKPLFVAAYNGNGFDYPYIYHRMKKNNVDVNELGLFGETELRVFRFENGQVSQELKAGGILYVDYLELYKGFTYEPRSSYSLDYVAEAELGSNKVQHDCYTSFDGFRTGNDFIMAETEPEDEYENTMWHFYKKLKVAKDSLIDFIKENNLENHNRLDITIIDNKIEVNNLIDYNINYNNIIEDKLNELFINYNNIKNKISNYANDYFVHYGIIDTYLLYRLDKKLCLLNILMTIASTTGVSPDEATTRVKPWERFISNTLFKDGTVIPDQSISSDEPRPTIKGGFVSDPVVGKHNWVISMDLSSAYPNLSMRGFNISPETLVPYNELPEDLRELKDKYFNDEDEIARFELFKSCLGDDGKIKPNTVYDKYTKLLKKYDLVGTMYGTFFRRDKQGIIPQLVAQVLKNRKTAKNEMLKHKSLAEEYKHKEHQLLETEVKPELAEKFNEALNKLKSLIKEHMVGADTKHVEQLVFKILANSLYGAQGFYKFKLFNADVARSITATTRFYLQFLNYRIAEELAKLGGYKTHDGFVIYNDTDSITGDTIIKTSVGNLPIQTLYNVLEGKVDTRKNNSFVKHPDRAIFTKSVNKNLELEDKQIVHLMKHKVKKRFYKIKVNNKEIKVTEDHSVMVLRDGELMGVKPSEIVRGDKLVIA